MGSGKYDPRIAPVRVRNELVMNVAPERIWSVLVRAVEWPNWYPNSKRVRIESGGTDLYLGAQFSWCTFGVCLKSVVQEFAPFERIAWTAKAIGIDAYHAWLIVPAASGCRVITEETQYGWMARLADTMMPNRMHHYHQMWLDRLALRCNADREAGANSP
jgi:Polyketide cyclase / dehydrase and lipid transport